MVVRRRRITALMVVLSWCSSVRAAEPPRSFFRPEARSVNVPSYRGPGPKGLAVVRHRILAVDPQALDDETSWFAPFDDLRSALVRASDDRAADGSWRVWTARLEGTRKGSLILSITGEVWSGSLALDNGDFFELAPAGPGKLDMREVRADEQSSADDVRVPPLPASGFAEAQSEPAAGANTQVDVMIVYTAAARVAAGGTPSIQNKIQLAVTEINLSYAQTGIPMELRLVHSREVSYDESGGIDAALTNLTGANDGFLDDLHSARDQYGADLVQLWINGPGSQGGTVGLAWLMSTPGSWFNTYAFSVVEVNFATGPYYSSGHEFGHNQGAHHDRAHASGSGAYEYAFGYQVATGPSPFRTIMSYACPNVYCPKINYWSDPDITYQGQPIGVAAGLSNSADNRLTLTNTREWMAAFRQPASPQPPQPGTVTPATGSGATQTFTATFTDGNGASDLAGAYLLVNNQIRADAGCFVFYNRAANSVQLLDDSGQWWSAPAMPGTGTLANSQCRVNVAGAAASASLNTLTLTLPLTFTSTFSGSKNLYLLATDLAGANSNWSLKGTWTVPSAPQTPAPQSVTPASGAGGSAIFTAVYSDGNGATDIAGAYLLVHSQIHADAGCFVYYNRAANTVQLLNNTGTQWSAPQGAGAGTLANSQCSVSGAGLSSSASGNNLTVTFPLSFSGAFAGSRNVYLLAVDSGGLNSNWSLKGTWVVPAANVTPVPVSLSPGSGSGSSQVFTATYSDGNGATDLAGAYLLVHSQARADSACFLYYHRSSNTLRLLNDAGAVWSSPITLGSGSLANTQCLVSGAGSSSSVSGSNLTVNFALTFTAAFAGARNLYLLGIDSSGANSNWWLIGTWTVPAPAQTPVPVSVTPASGSGVVQTFTAVYADGNGATDIAGAYFLFHNQVRADGGCFVYVNRAAGTVQLASDAGTAWSSPLAAGSGTLANSQCAINGAGASLSADGNNLTVTLPVVFQPAFAGARNTYLLAIDSGGLNSNWHLKGTWTAP